MIDGNNISKNYVTEKALQIFIKMYVIIFNERLCRLLELYSLFLKPVNQAEKNVFVRRCPSFLSKTKLSQLVLI